MNDNDCRGDWRFRVQIDIRAGCLLSIPVLSGSAYIAHVLRKNRTVILVAAYGTNIGESGEFVRPELVAVTFDVLVKAGEWKVVGHRDPDPTVPIPVYRVSDSSKNTTYIQDVNGHIRRAASADEVRRLFDPVTYSAAAFQKAVNQLARHEALEARFHPMLPDWAYCEQTLLSPRPSV